MKILDEFKKFALKGNAVDLAVGVVIGAAFGGVVNSLVNDLINPIIAIITGGFDFSSKVIVLKEATDMTEAITLNWGNFITTIINFLVISIAIFLVVKQMNKLYRKEEKKEEEKPKGPTEVELLTEIRDSLKN